MAGIFQPNVFQNNVFQTRPRVSGTVAAIQEEQLVNASGVVANPNTGTVATIQDEQIVNASGAVLNRMVGTVATAQDEQIVNATGSVLVPGNRVATIQEEQLVNALGTVKNPEDEINWGGGTTEIRLTPSRRAWKREEVERQRTTGSVETAQSKQEVAAIGSVRNKISGKAAAAIQRQVAAATGVRDVTKLNARKKMLILMALEAA